MISINLKHQSTVLGLFVVLLCTLSVVSAETYTVPFAESAAVEGPGKIGGKVVDTVFDAKIYVPPAGKQYGDIAKLDPHTTWRSQPESDIKLDRVVEYTKLLKEGSVPPQSRAIHYYGKDILTEGHHRNEAAKNADKTIEVKYLDPKMAIEEGFGINEKILLK